MKKIKATTLIRKALTNRGVNNEYIFTNVYKTCRTVKMYATKDAAFNDSIQRDMHLLAEIVPGLTVKLKYTNSYRGPIGSIIVRIPRDAADLNVK